LSDLASKIISLSPATTAGSGELNLVGSPSNASGWLSANGGGTLATTSTAGDLPLGTMVATAIKITSGTGASTEATLAETNSFAFTTPASYAVKTKVELWMRPGTLFLPNEWTVSVYAGSTRQALTTDSSSFTYLPNANGKFTTYFDAVASTAYTVRLTRKLNAGTNAAVLNVANVIVGPGVQPQGAVVGEWQSYTPTLTGFGSAVKNFYWRQCGDSIEIQATLQAGTPTGSTASFTLPNSWTAASIAAAASSYSSIGFWNTNQAAAAGSVITPQPGTNLLYFGTFGAVNSTSTGSAVCSGFNAVVTLSARLQINELAGSGTVNLAQNDVEYAYNSSTNTTTSDTTSFAYGPGGAAIQSITVALARRVRFQAPIQATDRVIVEVSSDQVKWVEVGGKVATINIDRYRYDGTNNVGLGTDTASANTDVDVIFGTYRAGTATTWAGAAALYWRVRKVSGGQAVGFGIVSGTSSGLLPASNTSLDDASATRLGLKQYLHGTTYNGGNAPTVTLASGGGTLTSVTRALFVPYQMQDGTWRLKFNAMLAPSSTSRTSVQFAVFGVAAKNVSYQAIIATTTAASQLTTGYVTPGTGTIMIADHNGAAVTSTFYSFSGDIELDSKPTWAY